jgi:hypothetical protein
MPKSETIVINTSPLITLVAALGDLTILRSLYTEVLVPLEVCQEITAGGRDGFAVAEFEAANWLQKKDTYLNISPFLLNSAEIEGSCDEVQPQRICNFLYHFGA